MKHRLQAITLESGSAWRRCALACYLVLVYGPILALVLLTVQQLADPQVAPDLHRAGLNLRQLTLLARSAGLALLVALCAMAAGTLAATALWQWTRGPRCVLRWWFLLLLFIPPYLQAQAWRDAVLAAISMLGASPAAGATSWGMSWLIEVLIYMPLATGLALLGLVHVDPQLLQAAQLSRTGSSILLRIALPLAAPQILAGGGLVFLFCLVDYGIPSLLQQSSYPLEIFTYFSGGGPAGGALLISLPMLLIAAAGLAAALGGLRELALSPVAGRQETAVALTWPWWLQLLQRLALALLALELIVPLAVYWRAAGRGTQVLQVAVDAAAELATTGWIALWAGLLALPLGYVLAQKLLRAKFSLAWWLGILAPAALPAPLLGIGLLVVWNRPGLSAVLDSLALPVLVVLARFTFVAALIIMMQLKRLDSSVLDAARVFCPSRRALWWRVYLPLYAPGLLGAGLLVAALSAGELGGTLLVVPPGRATLALRVYNYLHYGASAQVAGLCLLLTVLVLALALAAFCLYARGGTTPAAAGGRR